MTEIYRKWGRVVRYENGVTIRVEEAGEASEHDGVFHAAPIALRRAQLRWAEPPWVGEKDRDLAKDDEGSAQRGWALRMPGRVSVERLIASAGVAEHEAGGVAWTEETQRAHVSLIDSPLRVLIDLASFDAIFIEKIAGFLARAGNERAAPSRLRLAPNVSAALLPSLIGELAMEQRGGGFDGKGQLIETRAVTSDPPPNWYRPGYAVRPFRAWLNVCALPFGSIDRSAPIAVALLAPIEGTTLRVLCVDGDDVFPAQVDANRIAAVSRDEPEWYPYAAGSFGAEMML
jgi:hypothetical protein